MLWRRQKSLPLSGIVFELLGSEICSFLKLLIELSQLYVKLKFTERFEGELHRSDFIKIGLYEIH
jgi:hypothetical protein